MEAIEKQLEALKAQVEAADKRAPSNKLSMIVFSGDLDKVLSALIMASGAVAMGMSAVLFFTLKK